MPRRHHSIRLPIAALAAALLVASAAPAHAQILQSGDIVVPGNHLLDPYGSANGCFYRLRGGVVTRIFESTEFRGPSDMIIDSQGRLVFLAWPTSRNVNDGALFRIDPANGALERLFYFPYNVAQGDTLPAGAMSATRFNLSSMQSLHLQKGFGIVIDDDENGGWPQLDPNETYGFALSTAVPSGLSPTTYSYDPANGTCEVGISTTPLPWHVPPCMTNDGSTIYYGWGNVIAKTGAPTRVDLHLDGDWGHLDASLRVPPKNEVIHSAYTFDNVRYPNGFVDCGSVTDDNVPFGSNGTQFNALSMDGLGVLDGLLYVSSSSAGTGTPYVFEIADRGPFLDPYACQWNPAMKGRGMLDLWLPDGTPTWGRYTSPDGDGLLAFGNGVVKHVTPAGDLQFLDASQAYSGRPWRWHGASSAPVLAASASAVADSGAQVLVVRVDALAYVMLTDSQGRRIGYDAAGNPVNDFGEQGQLPASGGGGWPRLIVLRDPPNGMLSAEISATGPGAWTVKGYLAHEAGGSLLATTSGNSSGAGSVVRSLYVGQPTVLTWYESLVGVGDPTGTEGTGFVSVGPVPARGEVQLAYRVPGAGARVRLDIYDIAGRRVSTPVNGFTTGGLHTLDWRGDSASGARLATGIYLASLDVNGRRETRRIVLAH